MDESCDGKVVLSRFNEAQSFEHLYFSEYLSVGQHIKKILNPLTLVYKCKLPSLHLVWANQASPKVNQQLNHLRQDDKTP